MVYSEAKKKAAETLRKAGIEEAEVDAEYLLQYASGLERSLLFVKFQKEIPEEIEEKYQALIERRCSHEPLQYIIGNQDFMGHTFIVTPDVLIPRFDTEILAELAIKRAYKDVDNALRFCTQSGAGRSCIAGNDGFLELYRDNSGNSTYRILDLCTGSGCVATSVGLGVYAKICEHLCQNPNALCDSEKGRKCGLELLVTGADISEEALKVARKNWELNISDIQTEKNLPIKTIEKINQEDKNQKNGLVQINAQFIKSDLFESIEGRFHLITANPPYIVRDEIETLMPEITEHEPHLALDGGDDGMDFYRRIVKEAPNYLYPGGRLMMEFDDSQAEPVAKMMEEAGFIEIEVHRDLAHLRRVIEGKLQSEGRFSD